jgi:Ca-activated chloride channel family protein
MSGPLYFVWPQWLWILWVWPLLLLLYLWLLRRQKRQTLAYGQLGLVRQALSTGGGWRRHLPPLLMWLALGLTLLAAARPVASLMLPSNKQTVILAMDVSGSMRATDVEPNRLVASQNAAKAFLADLPRQVKVGIVAFAGSAQVVQPATHNRDDLVAAIDKFHLQRATAIGSAIVVSLAELFPEQRQELSRLTLGRNSDPFAPQGRAIDQPPSEAKPFVPVPPGSYSSAAIILLTDGQRTTGVDIADAAQLAADRGVRVYTVGVGTVDGEVIGFEGWSMRVRLDEDSLKQVARHTQGEYFYAGTADSLKQVYQSLGSRLTVEKKDTEIAGLLALLSGVLMLLAGGLSLAWYGRVL